MAMGVFLHLLDHQHHVFQYLSIFALSLFIMFVFLFKPTKSRVVVNLPPGKMGFPFIGETLEFAMASSGGTPDKFINDRTTKYSTDVFRTSLLGEKFVVFCGEEGNKFLLSSANKYLRSWCPHSLVKAMSNNNSNINFEKVSLKVQRMLPEFLKTNALQYYVPIMDSMVKHHMITDWLPNRVVKAVPLVEKCTLAIACRLFFKMEDPVGIKEPFTTLVAGILSLPIDLPFTKYRAALHASKIIHEKLLSVINRRKIELAMTKEEDAAPAPDLLTRLVRMRDENGNPMFTDQEISTGLVALLFVSHDTLTSAITFVLKHLGENPLVYQKVFKEQMEIAKTKAPGQVMLNWDDIQNMKYSWSVACESMRLTPPSQGSFREVITDITYKGFTIPKGWKAYWTVHSTHKNPNYFKEPEKFDPSRFEGGGPAALPYTYVPFGAGPHTCYGKEYARLGILTFIHNVVTNFKWRNLMPGEKNLCTVSTIPQNGLPIQIQTHPSTCLVP